MRKEFNYDSQKESATSYITRMAPILGTLRKDGVSGTDSCLISSIDMEEKRDIENEICLAFEKTICSETRRTLNMTKGRLDDYEDDYKNELRMAVFKDIHKFNNPAYLKALQSYSIDTFVRSRIPGVTKRILSLKRERKEYMMKRESHVKKVIAALQKEYRHKVPCSVEMIFENQDLAGDSLHLSLEQIWDVLALMEDPAYLEDETGYEAVTTEDGYNGVDQHDLIVNFLRNVSIYPEWEWYIYIQSLRLRLKETTCKEIACDKKLIEMCRKVPETRDKIVYERIVVDRPRTGIKPGTWFEEYISPKYIECIYKKIDKRFREICREDDIAREDILAILKYMINM